MFRVIVRENRALNGTLHQGNDEAQTTVNLNFQSQSTITLFLVFKYYTLISCEIDYCTYTLLTPDVVDLTPINEHLSLSSEKYTELMKKKQCRSHRATRGQCRVLAIEGCSCTHLTYLRLARNQALHVPHR